MTAPTAEAINRLDDGHPLPGDVALADLHDVWCQPRAFAWPVLVCVHGSTADCDSCFLDHDDLMRRAADV